MTSMYTMLHCEQGSPEWHEARKGKLTASRASVFVGKNQYTTKELAAYEICYLVETNVTYPMICGIIGEKYVRQKYEEVTGTNVACVGIAIMNENPLFRASLDGIVSGTLFIEIKILQKRDLRLDLYKKLLSDGDGPNIADYMKKDHYNQIMFSGGVTGLSECDYVVYCMETEELSIFRVNVDLIYFRNVLMPKSLEYYEKYIMPLMAL